MNRSDLIHLKIVDAQEAVRMTNRWKLPGKKIAFTNGVFDILHPGHIHSLSAAAREADYLVVGLNSDASVRRLKGTERPVNNEQSRAIVLASLVIVDAVVIFEEDTPLELVKLLMPDVIVKGGDYKVHEIAGAKEVLANGGEVILADLVPGVSTTGIIKKLRK